MKNTLGFVIALVLSTPAQAADMSCTIAGAVRCMCAASMIVKCPTGSGHISNDEKPSVVTIMYLGKSGEKREITLKNPKGGIRSYYAAQYNDEVKAELANAGVKFAEGDNLNTVSFTVPDSTPLYEDAEARKRIAVSSGGSQPETDCAWESRPSVVTAAGCGPAKFCVGTVRCKSMKNGTATAGCKAVNLTGCPSADVCAQDESVAMGSPSAVDFGKPAGAGSGAGAGR